VALQHNKWTEHYLDYNGLKRILAEETYTDQQDYDVGLANDHHYSKEEVSLVHKTSLNDEYGTSAKFRAELEHQIPRTALFVLQQQGRLAEDLLQFQSGLSEILLLQQDPSSSSTSSKKALSSSRIELFGKFHRMGAELLHLMQFVHLNRMALERILKKHDKRVISPSLRAYESYIILNPSNTSAAVAPTTYSAVTAVPLFQTESLDALCATLQSSYYDLMSAMAHFDKENDPEESEMERGRTMEREASAKRTRSPKGLGRNFQSIQGLDSLDQPAGLGQETQNSFLKLSERHYSDVQTATSQHQQDFIMAQIYAARRNLQQESRPVTKMLADTALGFPVEPPEFFLLEQEGKHQQEDDKIKAEYERAAALADYKQKSAISRILNLVSSFIYMTNYLIVVPTVVTYSNKLGANPAMSSAIVGMTPFATIFSTFLYSWWTSYSYKMPLLFASVLNVAGNIVYAMGYPCNSMLFVLLGRLMSGLGSCRPINRRYIADAYSTADRTAASAHFVAVGSFGMALGPFLGSVLHRIAENSSSPFWQVENAPGWFMAGVWFVYLIFHVLFFVDPPKEEDESPPPPVEKKSGSQGERKPLLVGQKSESSIENRVPIWKNSAVMVNFFIYFIEKLLMECVSSSTSILTYYYFDWPGSWA